VPHRSPPPQQTLPSIAKRKRLAAAKREREAAVFRAEADAIDRQWRDFLAERKTNPTRDEAVSA
jgi:hypothetical protein